MEKVICLLAAMIVTMSSLAKAEAIYFADPNLKVAVEANLDVTNPSPVDMLELISLDANGMELYDLTGLEYALNLEVLNLYNNDISNIFPISELTNLTHLNLLSNPLDTPSYCTHLPLVISNNPGIFILNDIDPNPLAYDCWTSFCDLSVFASQWLETDCYGANDWCLGADFDLFGEVDFHDFAIFAAYWVGNVKTKIIAHRGASYIAPENTVVSVMLSWQKGSDAAEIDVRLSSDNQIVVIHDSTTARTTGGIDLLVSDTNSAILRSLDVGSWKGAEYAGEKIPFLDEIIDTVPSNRKLFIEIKAGIGTIEPLIKDTIVSSGKMSQMVIISFQLNALINSRLLMPEVPAYWLIYGVTDEQDKLALIQTAHDNGLDGLAVHQAMVTESFAQAVLSAGQKLYVWTVDSDSVAIWLVELGLDGIITNRPGWIRDRL